MSKNTAKILSACLQGLQGRLVEVETDLHANLPSVMIVGLPDKSVEESKERVRSAIRASGFSFPRCRVVVNLAPADLKKHGPLYDLPIGLSILAAQGELNRVDWSNKIFVGELSLNGETRPITGALSIAKMAKRLGVAELYLPEANCQEAAMISGIKIKPVISLIELFKSLRGSYQIGDFSLSATRPYRSKIAPEVDINDIWGQEQAKRALAIAAAGRHNIALIGPPGTGKTMLAKALASILPPLSDDEAIEVAEVYSAAGLIKNNLLNLTRPFRSPHHGASVAAMIGGGNPLKPGEITLAHQGVLHLDEITEFNRQVLESLREPLEEGEITVLRAAGRYKLPADFMMIATLNPCPCGFRGSQKECRCSPARARAYWQKISGPLLDRIDIFVWLEPVAWSKIGGLDGSVNSSGDNEATRTRQKILELSQRPSQSPRKYYNSRIPSQDLAKRCPMDGSSRQLLREATGKLQLSTRGFVRVIKVARTIADLDASPNIKAPHIGEALQYRFNERLVLTQI